MSSEDGFLAAAWTVDLNASDGLDLLQRHDKKHLIADTSLMTRMIVRAAVQDLDLSRRRRAVVL